MANPKRFNSPLIKQLAQALIKGQGTPMEQAVLSPRTSINFGKNLAELKGQDEARNIASNFWKNVDVETKNGISGLTGTENYDASTIEALQQAMQPKMDEITNLQDISNGVSLQQLGKLGLNTAKRHPFKTAGLIGLGAGNIGGLMDNNKFGGQLGGLALGGIGSYLAGVSPYTAAMMTMGGGELGALFDKLRAKREQQNQQPYYGGR